MKNLSQKAETGQQCLLLGGIATQFIVDKETGASCLWIMQWQVHINELRVMK